MWSRYDWVFLFWWKSCQSEQTLLVQISFQLQCCLSFRREGHNANPWTSVCKAPSAKWLLINSVFPAFSFPTLLGPVWQRFLKDVCPILPVSRDCQKAHLHKISTNIRVSGPDLGFFFGGHGLYFLIYFDGSPSLTVAFLPNFQNSKFQLLLSSQIWGLVSPSPTSLQYRKDNVQTMFFPTEICLSPAPSLGRLSWSALVLAAW